MKGDIKELIKKNGLNNILVYLVSLFIIGGLLFISFIALLWRDYTTYGIICLVLSIIFIVLGIFLKINYSNSNWDQLSFEIEKDFDMNLVYSDNYLAMSNEYILFYKSRKIFKVNNILFYFINNNSIKIYVRDDSNTIYDYNFKYNNVNTFNNVANVLKAKAFDANLLYRDNLLMFSANAMYDFNKICGTDVIVLKTVRELIRNSDYEFTIHVSTINKDYNGVFKYNDVNMCNQTFNYLCNNCNIARIYYSMEEYRNK